MERLQKEFSWNRVTPLSLNALALGGALLFFCSLVWLNTPLAFGLASLGAVVIACGLGGYLPWRALGLNRATIKDVLWLPFLTYLSVIPGILIISFLTEWFYRKLGLTWEPQTILKDFLALKEKREIIKFAFLAVILAPFAEEILFRGFLYAWLKSLWPKWVALVFSAFVFALIHQHLPVFFPLMLLGFVLALLYERTGSLWSSIALHALFNSVTLIIALNFPELILR